MVKTIKEKDLQNKKVIMRVDYNVTLVNGQIQSSKKIDDTFQTIDYLINQNCSIILLSHFGRVKSAEDKENNSLKPIYEYIKNLNKYDIYFCGTPKGNELVEKVRSLAPKQILLVENTRFLDLEDKLESNCDDGLSQYWASLAEFYIDDAFGSMHRNHASVTGIPKYLPSAIGFLAEKEINNLNVLLNNPPKPFVVIMGGAKLEDKIELIYTLAEKADYMLLGGGIANTFLKAAGFHLGASLYSKESVEVAKALMQEFPDKIILPKDVITSPSFSETIYELKPIHEVEIDDVIGDIGYEAINNYKKIIDNAATIFINGTVGMYEKLQFSNGTQEILRIVGEAKGIKVVGGGDALSAVKKFKQEEKMNFISTGGGATLSYIANGTLPGIEAIK